jgi:RNA polymerase sigma factor (sigma-70 family)
MATNQLRRVLQTLRNATLPADEERLTDGQLLECYIRSREEAAFAALVRRHGPMVWGVCRRILRSHQDAEDAFQATFLVLVRKATSIVSKDKLANWLYGVAHQTALKARATTARRQEREKQVTAMPEPALKQHPRGDDLQPLLDQELSRLPDKYRTVLVLCDLQGKTRKEAALHLHLPEGTVATRLATARSMLAKRLARYGQAVSVGVLATVLTQERASASVPTRVASSTIKAAGLFAAGKAAVPGVLSAKAVALAEGVLKTMLLTKLKIATAVLVTLLILGGGAAAVHQQASASKPGDPVVTAKPETVTRPLPEKKPGETNTTIVTGVVKAVSAETNMFTISNREGEKAFTVANDAAIVVNGKPTNLARLPKGAFASVSLLADAKTATRIEAVGPQLDGVVKAVDAEKRTLTILVGQGGGEKIFTMTRTGNIQVDGHPATLAALPLGANVSLSWFADLKTARNLEATGSWWQGIRIKTVDATRNTITIDEGQREVELAGKSFPVCPVANISMDGKPAKIAAVPPGTVVTLYLCADQKTVRGFNADGPPFFDVVVKSVDVDKSTITFADVQLPAEAELAGKTLPVTKDAGISIDFQPGKLARLPAGAIVNVTLSVNRQTVRNLSANGRGFQNVPVKAVDAAKRTITFADDKAPAELAGKTFPVARNAGIEVDSRPGKFEQVPAGASINVTLSVDMTRVLLIFAAGSQIGNPGGVIVVAVDLDKNTITVDIPEEGEKTFAVAKDATIEVDGKPGRLTMVPKEAFVTLTLSVDQKTVRGLHAHGLETNSVLVKAVDAAMKTITFANEGAPPAVAGKTCPVAKDAEIVVDGKPSKLAEIPPGATVWLWLAVDQKTVVRLHAGGAQLGGFGGVVVQAVDAEKKTITVDINGEGEKTFAVAKDASIRINGKSAKLADLPKEAAVTLNLCVDQKTVRYIEAKTQ